VAVSCSDWFMGVLLTRGFMRAHCCDWLSECVHVFPAVVEECACGERAEEDERGGERQ
jgi:hypothetical protein